MSKSRVSFGVLGSKKTVMATGTNLGESGLFEIWRKTT